MLTGEIFSLVITFSHISTPTMKTYQSKRLSLCGAGNFSGKCSVDPSVYFFHYSSTQAMEFPVVFVDKCLSTRGQPSI